MKATMTINEIYIYVRDIDARRGGSDWLFDRDNRLVVEQKNGGVDCRWFDGVLNKYRRTYLKGVTIAQS